MGYAEFTISYPAFCRSGCNGLDGFQTQKKNRLLEPDGIDMDLIWIDLSTIAIITVKCMQKQEADKNIFEKNFC